MAAAAAAAAAGAAAATAAAAAMNPRTQRARDYCVKGPLSGAEARCTTLMPGASTTRIVAAMWAGTRRSSTASCPKNNFRQWLNGVRFRIRIPLEEDVVVPVFLFYCNKGRHRSVATATVVGHILVKEGMHVARASGTKLLVQRRMQGREML